MFQKQMYVSFYLPYKYVYTNLCFINIKRYIMVCCISDLRLLKAHFGPKSLCPSSGVRAVPSAATPGLLGRMLKRVYGGGALGAPILAQVAGPSHPPMNISNTRVSVPVLVIFLVTHTIGMSVLGAVLLGGGAAASVASALSSEQRALDNTGVDSSMPGGLAIVPSEFFHRGATTKAMPKRSRSVEDDGRLELEKFGKKSAAEEHIEDNAIFNKRKYIYNINK